MILIANVLQPLIDVAQSILNFWHDSVGLQLGRLDHHADGLSSGSRSCR